MSSKNPYPYEAKPTDLRITQLGWPLLTRREAEDIITAAVERAHEES